MSDQFMDLALLDHPYIVYVHGGGCGFAVLDSEAGCQLLVVWNVGGMRRVCGEISRIRSHERRHPPGSIKVKAGYDPRVIRQVHTCVSSGLSGVLPGDEIQVGIAII